MQCSCARAAIHALGCKLRSTNSRFGAALCRHRVVLFVMTRLSRCVHYLHRAHLRKRARVPAMLLRTGCSAYKAMTRGLPTCLVP
jgi:hypothetical protein